VSSSDLDVLAYEPSPLGMICLRRRTLPSDPEVVVTEITLDHLMLMSSCNSASERALSRRALDLHEGKDLKVLVGGLGLGTTAREALRSDRVAQVEVVELLPQVIDWLDRGLLPLAGELRADPRFAVSEGDVYARLSGPAEQKRDLILIDVDHSPDETLSAANDSLGVLGVWSYAESSPFAETLRRVFDEVRVEPLTFENRLLDEAETHWLFYARG
jgi:spermidine synthase